MISFLTDLAPFVSQAILVIFNFSSGASTFPVINILPSKTLVLTFKKCFLSIASILLEIVFCIMESSICVPTVLGSIATDTPVPNKPVELTPGTQPDKIIDKKIIIKILNFIF